VSYKRFSNPDGPTYILPVSDIRYIQYANGEKEYFTDTQPEQGVDIVAVAPAPTPQPQPVQVPPQSINKTFEIGDIYDYNGVKGIVCSLSEDKQHGLIMSLDEVYSKWNIYNKGDFCLAGADSAKDGAANMEKIAAYVAQNNLSWGDFPAFKWCRDKGEGWYLPSIDELLIIGNNYNGGTRYVFNRQARQSFNDSLKINGGKGMNRLVYYFSSTEIDEKNAYTSHMGTETPFVINIPKNSSFLVRAVRKF
jgi:hypothetical protein